MSPGPRSRVRTTECAIPNCTNTVRRANAYRLCINHLVGIWEFVGEELLPEVTRKSMYFEPRMGQPASDHVLTVEEQEARRLARRMGQIKSAKSNGTIYVLDTRDGDLVKIGWTSRPLGKRLAQYPPRYRVIITAPGTMADERDVHRSLKHARVAGREWYRIEPEVVRQINTWVAQANIRRSQAASRSSDETDPSWSKQFQNRSPLVLLPRFESIEQWFSEKVNAEVHLPPSMPAPQSRLGARRA